MTDVDQNSDELLININPEQQLSNGAPAATEGQLINVEDNGGYHVEVRQQTEHTSHTAEQLHQQPDGTQEVCCPVCIMS